MKKIVILSYNFAPRKTVGAIRPTKLAEYLTKDGYIVDVVTVTPFGELDHSFDDVIKNVNHFDYIDVPVTREKEKAIAKAGDRTLSSTKKDKPKLYKKFKNTAYEVYKIIRYYRYAFTFKKLLLKERKRFEGYDIAFSTYGPVSSHLCGLIMKKYCPKVRWIADFRDPMVVNATTFFPKLIRGHIQRKTCKKADVLVAVSKGYYQRIFGNKYNYKARVIYNGYDRGDFDPVNTMPDGLFSFTYIGNLYDGKRDLTPLFYVIRELIDEGEIPANDVCIKYAGTSYSNLYSQAQKYNLADCLRYMGNLDRRNCLELQYSSRHLILSTWNEKNELGVFPGKFLEYIMMNKSIISLVAGDVPDSEVTRVMEDGRLGFSYEQAGHDRDIKKLKEYVKNDYHRYKKGLAPDLNPDTEVINGFDYKNVAKQIESLF